MMPAWTFLLFFDETISADKKQYINILIVVYIL